VVAALLDFLHAKQTVLVLDNCEHVIGAVADLVREIAERCRVVSMLATSREDSASRVSVSSSSAACRFHAPAPGSRPRCRARPPAVRRTRSGGAHRFHRRCRQRRRGGRICRRLDGIPLAIELAAARTRALSPGEIAQRLGERFRLLTGGSRTAVERHQTLRAAATGPTSCSATTSGRCCGAWRSSPAASTSRPPRR